MFYSRPKAMKFQFQSLQKMAWRNSYLREMPRNMQNSLKMQELKTCRCIWQAKNIKNSRKSHLRGLCGSASSAAGLGLMATAGTSAAATGCAGCVRRAKRAQRKKFQSMKLSHKNMESNPLNNCKVFWKGILRFKVWLKNNLFLIVPTKYVTSDLLVE